MDCGCGGSSCGPGPRAIRWTLQRVMGLVLVLAAGVLALVLAGEPGTLRDQRPVASSRQPVTPGAVVRNWGLAEPKPRTPGAIRVATYNAENLFMSFSPQSDEGRVSEPKPESQLRAVARAIRRIDADVVAIEEVESLETLTKFRDTYLAGAGYTHIASIDAGDPRGIEQGVLSRYPLRNARVQLHQPLGGTHPPSLGRRVNPEGGRALVMKRSPLMVTVVVPAHDVAKLTGIAPGASREYVLELIVVHHKSGRDYDYLREAEARAVIELARPLRGEGDTAHVLIAGDFNATPSATSLRLYHDAGFADALGEPRPAHDPALVTHTSGRVIDHLLVSPALRKAVVRGSFFVLGTPDRPRGVDWRTTLPPDGWGSDHYPVVVDIRPLD